MQRNLIFGKENKNQEFKLVDQDVSYELLKLIWNFKINFTRN